MFSTFLPFALLFGAFCLRALRGFGLGSGCLTVSARSPASRRLFLVACALGFGEDAFDFLFPQRQCASFLPAVELPFFASDRPALEHSALLIFAIALSIAISYS